MLEDLYIGNPRKQDACHACGNYMRYQMIFFLSPNTKRVAVQSIGDLQYFGLQETSDRIIKPFGHKEQHCQILGPRVNFFFLPYL